MAQVIQVYISTRCLAHTCVTEDQSISTSGQAQPRILSKILRRRLLTNEQTFQKAGSSVGSSPGTYAAGWLSQIRNKCRILQPPWHDLVMVCKLLATLPLSRIQSNEALQPGKGRRNQGVVICEPSGDEKLGYDINTLWRREGKWHGTQARLKFKPESHSFFAITALSSLQVQGQGMKPSGISFISMRVQVRPLIGDFVINRAHSRVGPGLGSLPALWAPSTTSRAMRQSETMRPANEIAVLLNYG
ncbi:hypothetical protein BGZ63DRAFT_404202 [Mariannaea sp. PMI_226]|nr:hypothetical protein BGZ63DRAFT_404202 [Mariannaea sp. PMI_226]